MDVTSERRRRQEEALAQIDLGPGIDAQARERAEGWISELAEHVGKAELLLATLGGFCDGDLAGAIVGSMGIKADEIREQLAPLREAVRGMER